MPTTALTESQDIAKFFDPLGGEEFGGRALQVVGHDGALIAAHFGLGLGQHHDAAGREHDVVIQLLAKRLVKAARFLVDRGGGVLKIV